VSGRWAIGVDLGGTKILAGHVHEAGALGRTIERSTPASSEDAVIVAVNDVIDELLDPSIVAVGIGAPVNFDPVTGVAFRATNLPLTDVDLRGSLRAASGLPCGLENDGNAAALAESVAGAGRGATDMVMLTLGTGVGGGLVLGGRLYRGWAEVGHLVVDVGGAHCQGSCHGHGHLEGLVSGTAADTAARELFGDDADARMLVSRAAAGDPRAVAGLERIGTILGAAIGSLVNLFNPQIVVIGGGFGSAAGELLLEPARRSARAEAIAPADETLRIVPAELGSEAGLIGAGLIGFAELDREQRSDVKPPELPH
jgi:glucokinase